MNKLNSEVQLWKKNGSRSQEGIDCSKFRQVWIQSFPDSVSFFESLPDIVNREVLRDVCTDPNLKVVEKFLAVMVWGYSDLGYGTYRVREMLKPDNSIAILEMAASISAKGQPKAAYQYLMQNRIPILGPSYASKFICFMTPKEISAPILDSLILQWIRKYCSDEFNGLSIGKIDWNLSTYGHYCDWIENYSKDNSCFPEDVELVLFRLAENEFSKKSKWKNK